MDRSEPALVPQWLKVASGSGSGSTTSHSSSSLQSGRRGSHNDYDSSRYSTLTDRTLISSSRRGPSTNGGISDRSNHDRAYSGSSRSSSLRGYDAPERVRDWERDIDLREREKLFGRDYREKDSDRFDNHQWSSSSLASKYENDPMLKRSQSMISNRKMENGSRKSGNELGSITSPLVLGNMVNSMQKAAFERNFPSLGSEDRHGGNQSNLALNPSGNSIWHGQGIVGAADVGRASSPGLTVSTGSNQGIAGSGLSAFGADGWSSALADVSGLNGGSNGMLTSAQQVASGTSVLPVNSGPTSTSGLNMAEALVQNPPRVRTPPQLFIETQRLEELALKQSRQLIPVTPPMPKTTGLGPSEKLKPKSLRGIDSSPSTGGKVGQIGSSQLNSPLRQTARPETPKQPQVGKLLVLKPVREKNGVSKSVKSDSSSPTKGGNINNSTIGAPTAGISSGGSAGLIITRKVKPLSDSKTVPVSSTSLSTGFDCVTGQRSKDNSLMIEEKKHPSQAQNRSDFFKALRRKASGTVPVTRIQDKSSTSTEPKSLDQERNGAPYREGKTEANENGSIESVGENSGISLATVEIACSWNNNVTDANGVDHGEIHAAVDSRETGNPTSVNRYSVMGGSEEEENAFLRSLGWEENAGGEEALTEEEINSFYQEQMKSRGVDATFCQGNYKLQNVPVQMPVGSLESVSSGMSSSDSEPDSDSDS